MSDFYICKVLHQKDTVMFYDANTRKFTTDKRKATTFDDLAKALRTRTEHELKPLETEYHSIMVLKN